MKMKKMQIIVRMYLNVEGPRHSVRWKYKTEDRRYDRKEVE